MGHWTGTIDCIHVFIKQTAGAGLCHAFALEQGWWQGYWSFQSNSVNAMKTLHWITQISEVVFQWWQCKSVSCALLHWCDVMCWKTQLSLHHNVYTAAEWCRVMAKQSNGVVLGVPSSQSRASSNWSTLQHTGSFPAWDFDKVTKNLPEEFSKMCELARDKLRVGWSLICSNSHLLRIHR